MDRMPAALVTYASTLVHLHLGQAVDSCIIAHRFATKGEPGQKPLERRYAIGSIIHGYAALEGVANKLKFEVFDNVEGRHYTPTSPKDLATRRYLEEWRDRVNLEDKLVFLSEKKGRPFVVPWIDEVREMRKFRHLLAHGLTVKALLLFEESSETEATQLAEQDWYYDKKFPIMKFSRPDQITFADAKRALQTVLNSIYRMNETFNESDIAFVYEWPDHPMFSIGQDVEAVKMILDRIGE